MKALVRWFQKEGPNWKNSVRNKHNAVDALHRQLLGAGPEKTGEGMVALSHARDESRAIVQDLFQGQKLVYRSGFWNKLAGPGMFGKIGAKITVTGVVYSANTLSGGAIVKGVKSAPARSAARSACAAKAAPALPNGCSGTSSRTTFSATSWLASSRCSRVSWRSGRRRARPSPA